MTDFLNNIVTVIAKVIVIPLVAVTSWAGIDIGHNVSLAPLNRNMAVLERQVEQALGQIQGKISLGTFQPSGSGTYRLASSIGTTNTTIRLSSFTEPKSELPYTMTILGSDTGFGTLEPQSPTRSEFVKFTGITQNSDGSATLTGVTRGLPRSNTRAGCTGSTTLAASHGAQSLFILSDSPCFFNEYAIKQNDETITGSWLFPAPVENLNPATKAYVDTVLTGTTTISTDKLVVAGTAGETVAAGNLVYLKTSDGRWWKIDTDDTSTTFDAVFGISQGAGTAGSAISGGVLLSGLDANQSGLVAGANYFASSTAGGLGFATTSLSVGKARTTSSIYVSPVFTRANEYGPNNFTGINTFSTTTATSTMIGSFPAWQIGKQIRVFTATSTFTPPSGISVVTVHVVGAGGGGGGGASSGANNSSGGGGGGGATCIKNVDVSATTSITVAVGAAGTGGANTGTSGTTGGTSYFGSLTLCSATGGTGGTGVGGSGGSGSGGNGGTATGGDVNVAGAGGGAGVGGAANTGAGGNGGSSMFGGGSSGSSGGGASPIAGYGGGGGGSTATTGTGGRAGADGAAGVVIVTW